MSDRGLLFLFSILVIVVCLGTCGALLMNGQAESVDGLFLILMCLAVALAFALYLMFMIRRAMEPPPAPAEGWRETGRRRSPQNSGCRPAFHGVNFLLLPPRSQAKHR